MSRTLISDAVRDRREQYTVTSLFCELDGHEFARFRDLVDRVLDLMNAHLEEFPVTYRYRDALTMAERQGWLRLGADGRAVTVVCPSGGAGQELLAA